MFYKRLFRKISIFGVQMEPRTWPYLYIKNFGEISVGEFPIGEFSKGKFDVDEFTVGEFI